MSKVIKFVSFMMAFLMSFFSPLNITHGQGSCCAECVMKREDELEIVYEDEDEKERDEE